jgi:hypothetical protein
MGSRVSPESTGEQIVKNAAYLMAAHPNWTAIHILDRAMLGRLGLQARFVFGDAGMLDHLVPPQQFAVLLRKAFAPDLSDSSWPSLIQGSENESTLNESATVKWNDTIIQFRARYGLWD